jgi:hypothetical protein
MQGGCDNSEDSSEMLFLAAPQKMGGLKKDLLIFFPDFRCQAPGEK